MSHELWYGLTWLWFWLCYDLIWLWYDMIWFVWWHHDIWYDIFHLITLQYVKWCDVRWCLWYIYIYIMFVDLFFSCAIGLMWVNHELVNLWSESVINPWVSWVRQCCSRSLKWSLFGARVRAARSPGTLHPEDPFQRKSCYIIYIYILVKSLNCNVYTRNA